MKKYFDRRYLNEESMDRSEFEVLHSGITVGQVVDTNDPQQMGRLRVLCPAFGDDPKAPFASLPWAMYCAPLGGTAASLPRGPEDEESKGSVAYGFWGIPKEGSFVFVTLIDQDPSHRIWIGSAHGQYKVATLPHGRYTYIEEDKGEPDGPLTSLSQPIEPLYTNQGTAFGGRSNTYEYRSRGADHQASAVRIDLEDETNSFPDDFGIIHTGLDGKKFVSIQGYGDNKLNPEFGIPETDGINTDSEVYSWTTPGFHSISMDDSSQNCRMRMRTTTGHQIIMDDTNERIYIATAEGNNWIEFDNNGNIDIFSNRRVSVHATSDINLNSDESIRMHAGKGIHMYAAEEIRMHSKTDLNFYSEANVNLEAGNNMVLESGNNLSVNSGAVLYLASFDNTYIASSGDIIATGDQIHFNGPPAQPPPETSVASNKQAYWTNRSPQHESWGRVMYINTDNDTGNMHKLELEYDDPNVGKLELGNTVERGTYWRR